MLTAASDLELKVGERDALLGLGAWHAMEGGNVPLEIIKRFNDADDDVVRAKEELAAATLLVATTATAVGVARASLRIMTTAAQAAAAAAAVEAAAAAPAEAALRASAAAAASLRAWRQRQKRARHLRRLMSSGDLAALKAAIEVATAEAQAEGFVWPEPPLRRPHGWRGGGGGGGRTAARSKSRARMAQKCGKGRGSCGRSTFVSTQRQTRHGVLAASVQARAQQQQEQVRVGEGSSGWGCATT